MEEIRITTDTLTKARKAQIESESLDALMARTDARWLIENKKRKRHAEEIVIREEKMMLEAQLEEERMLGSSRIATATRNQTTKVHCLQHERDDALLSCQNASDCKGVSLQRELAAALVAVQELKAEREEFIRQKDIQIRHLTNANVRLESELDYERQNAQARCKELEMMKNAAEIAVREEKKRLEVRFANERRLCIALEDDRKKKDRESLARVRYMEVDKHKLVGAELDKQKQTADGQIRSLTSDKTLLQTELDAARVAIERGKTEYENKLVVALLEKENVQKKLDEVLALVERERDASSVAMAQKKAQVEKLHTELATVSTKKGNLQKKLDDVEFERGATRLQLDEQKTLVETERNDKLKLQTALTDLMGRKRRLEYDVSKIQQEAAEDRRKVMAAHRNELDNAKTDIVQLKREVEYLNKEKNRLEKLEYDATRIQEEDVRQLAEANWDILHLENSLREETNRVEQLDCDVRRIQEEAAEAKKILVQAYAIELDKARTAKDLLRMDFDSLREEKARLEQRESFVQEEAAEAKRKLEQVQKELDEVVTDKVQLRGELESAWDERNRLIRLDYDVDRMQEEAAEEQRILVEAHNVEIDGAMMTIDHVKMELAAMIDHYGPLENDGYFLEGFGSKAKRKLVVAHKNELNEVKTQKAQLTREVASLTWQKNRLEKLAYNACRIQEGTEDKREFVQAHKLELDETRTHMVNLKVELDSLTEERNRLDSAHTAIERNLEEEKEKSLCQICLESPKDTISLPCSHFHYCFPCLERHKQRTNSCPSCRTHINAIFRFNMCS